MTRSEIFAVPPPQAAAIERFVLAYRASRPLALLLDFDGTLSPIVDHPRDAALAPGAGRLLCRLAELPRTLVGFVSGRAIDDLKPRAKIPLAWHVGTNGLEIEQNGTRFPVHVPSTAADLLRTIAARLKGLAAECPGCWLEVKPLGLTLHFRQAPAERVIPLTSSAQRVLREFSDAVLVVSGPAAIEIMPAVGCTKGTAVRMLCGQTGNAALPLYAGDSDNDLPAFEAAAELGGITIAVGERVDFPASFRVADPAALIAWLEILLERLTFEASRIDAAGPAAAS
jgi:trehalose 6-phosphate phosphatase